MKTIVKMVFGSHLYGTDIEGSSDRDYKGIFLPDKEQIYLGKIPKSLTSNTKKSSDTKNTSEDIDTEIYSLHYFLNLACEGQTVALDMLHCPDNLLLETSDVWKFLVANREKFYTRNLNSFVGYARKQAAKYGIKGSRLNDCKRVIDFLLECYVDSTSSTKLSDIWDELPEPDDHHNLRMYEVCGRKVQETATVEYCLPIFEKFYKNYGKRAKKAAKNEGIDWKAISHALRAAFQVRDILTKGTMKFPLEEAEFLKQVKRGEFDYLSKVAPQLDRLMDKLEELSSKSTLPEKVNRKFWDEYLIEVIDKWIVK